MVIPRYSAWITDASMSEEQQIFAMRTTILPAIEALSDGSPLRELITRNPWLSEFLSMAANNETDTAYRTSPNDMTIAVLEFVDAYYGTKVAVGFQRRFNEGLVERYR